MPMPNLILSPKRRSIERYRAHGGTFPLKTRDMGKQQVEIYLHQFILILLKTRYVDLDLRVRDRQFDFEFITPLMNSILENVPLSIVR